ncbi:MAG: GEVED domain-containing protein, partial [Bacteroidota bacterium]
FAIGDLNADGYLDVYAGYANLFNNPSNINDVLFINDGGTQHFFSVLLQGTTSNRNGIGARVELHGDWGIQIREVRSGEGYGIMNSFRQHFGIGAAEEITKLVVRWPSGTVDELLDPAIDQQLTLVEGSTIKEEQSIDFPMIADKLTTDLPFELQATASSGLALSFSLIDGPASLQDNLLTLTGTPGMVTVRASQPGNAQYHPALPVERSFAVHAPQPVNYCTRSAEQPWIEWIANVQFGDIDHTTFKTPYGDYTDISTTLGLGAELPIRLTPAFSWPVFDEHWRVWIDWNQDGDFLDANETVVEANDEGVIHTLAQVPVDAMLGKTRMRVAMQRDAYAEPCASFLFGEVEDYTVEIIDAGVILNFNCPTDINSTALPGANGATINWASPVASSNCPTGNVLIEQLSGLESGSVFPIGSTVITYQATGDCGQTATCSFTVTVLDGGMASLSLSCPSAIQLTAAPGANTTTATWLEPIADANCPNGQVSLTQTMGPMSGSSFEIGTTTIAYQATDECGNSETCSFTVTVLEYSLPPSGYCTASSQTPWLEWIANVQLGDINNASFKESYGDFTDQSTTLALGETYPIILTHGFSWDTHDEYWQVWIDWNQDHDFSDPDELVVAQLSPAPALGTTLVLTNGLISVPSHAATGTTRMRVAMKREASADACEIFQNGEVEDYTIEVVDQGPVLRLTCPDDLTVVATPGANSTVVDWPSLSILSNCPTGTPSWTQIAGAPAGSSFPLGETTVGYVATDACGNETMCSFTLTVLAFSSTLTLDCPANQSITASPGSQEVMMNWDTPIATSDCPEGNLVLTQIEGPEPGSLFPLGNTTIQYEATDACGNLASCSFVLTVLPYVDPLDYCVSQGEQPWQEWIGRVQLGTIDQESGKDLYGDFTDARTIVELGSTQSIRLQASFSWVHFEEYFKVWIDWNQDGDFLDEAENVLTATSVLGTPPNAIPPVEGTFTVPPTAALGATRMRVSMQKEAYPAPCGHFVYGEVEDYTIIVNEPSSAVLQVAEELLVLTAQSQGGHIRLNWVNNTAYKNDYFQIERSSNGQNFVELQQMEGSANSSQPIQYQWIDSAPRTAWNHYRIKLVFADGTVRYSAVQSVWWPIDEKTIAIFPNPTQDQLYLSLSEYTGQAVQLHISNLQGQTMLEQQITELPVAPWRIDVQDYLNGLYLLQIKVEGRAPMSQRFVVNRLY